MCGCSHSTASISTPSCMRKSECACTCACTCAHTHMSVCAVCDDVPPLQCVRVCARARLRVCKPAAFCVGTCRPHICTGTHATSAPGRSHLRERCTPSHESSGVWRGQDAADAAIPGIDADSRRFSAVSMQSDVGMPAARTASAFRRGRVGSPLRTCPPMAAGCME